MKGVWIIGGTCLAALVTAGLLAQAQVDVDLNKLLNDINAPTQAVPPAAVAPAPAPEPAAAPAPEPAPAPAPAPEPPAAAPAPEPAPAPAAGIADILNVAPAPAPEAAPAPAPEAAPAAPEAAPAAPPEGSPQDAKVLAEQERVTRAARELEGKKALASALEALGADDYATAAKLLDEALAKVPVRAENDALLASARTRRAEAAYRLAKAAYDRGDYAEARKQLEAARKDKEYASASASLERSIARREQAKVEAPQEGPVPPRKTEEYKTRTATAAALFAEGKQYFEIEDYDRAERNFERILLLDPYHKDAMRFLRRIEERRIAISSVHREATVADMVREVRDRWNPPIREAVAAPSRPEPGKPVSTGTSARLLQEKMNSIVIPSIEFRTANIVDVINFLRDASEAADPAKVGVNIILKLDTATPPAPAAGGAVDEWGFPVGGAGAAPAAGAAAAAPSPLTGLGALAEGGGGASAIPAISLNLRRVSLLDAIKYVTEIAGLRYRIEENAVIITPANVPTGNIITRFYPVQPSILDVVVQRGEQQTGGDQTRGTGEFIQMGGTAVTMKRDDVRTFFERAGVPFPPGTSITYNSSISQLIVANTAENLELFERVLAQLNVIPNQVEIEARFVQIQQTDLEELGVQWLLTDHYEIANKKGPGPITSRERIQINANSASGGFTTGLRYMGGTGTGIAPVSQGSAGALLSVSSVLTNPELSMILHALQQKGNADVLSAPRVTTRSGVNAQIQVVREIIYPTEYEQQDIGDFGVFGDPNQNIADLQALIGSFRPPIPSSFETREVGVILNVTPTVGPDGYTIDLTMVPEVAELVEWIDYGPPNAYPILQPIFASRNVTTSIVLWDGQTVVMGGLIREQAISNDDRIPLLGDLPLIGALFRSKGKSSVKENLLIFVTARLVDPAGNPIHPTGIAARGTVATPEPPKTP